MNDLEVISNFEGSMVGRSRIEKNRVFIEIRKERITKGYKLDFDYNIHFHFGISNHSESEREVEVFLDCDVDSIPDQVFRNIWGSSDIRGNYEYLNIEGRSTVNRPMRFYFKVTVEGKGVRYLANYIPVPYEEIKQRLEFAIERTGGRKYTFGRSVEGRDLTAIEYGDINKKHTLLFVAGFHPPEQDATSIIGILERMGDEGNLSRILKNFSLVFIPVVNPDGYVHMMQGSNMNEINFHWKFFENSIVECPESHALWDYCLKVRPVFYLDFHAFTFWDMRSRPYTIPPSYMSSPYSRYILKEINRDLKELCGGRSALSDKILAPDILPTGLRREFGTITSPKFHVDMKEGLSSCEKLSADLFKKVIRAFDTVKELDKEDLLLRPHGRLSKGVNVILRDRVMDLIYTRIRPTLSRMKSKL